MATESNAPPPVDAMSEQELAERALYARRMHRNQMTRRGLITTVILGIVLGLSYLLYPVVNHLRASWYLSASGLKVDWNVDDENWMSGGVSSVDHNARSWTLRSADPYLQYLPELLHLQTLNLSECEVTEDGLSGLAPLTEL